MTEVASYIKALFQRHDASARVTIDGIPPCLLAEHAEHVHNQLYVPAHLLGRHGDWRVYQVMPGYQIRSSQQKLEYPAIIKVLPPGCPPEEEDEIEPLHHAPGCEQCIQRAQCPGLWPYYVDKFGLDEFEPVLRSPDVN